MSSRRRSIRSDRVVDALLNAYRRGYFPMAEPCPPWAPWAESQIHWFSPDPRGILPLSVADGFHVARRLEQRLRSHPFRLTVDAEFLEVMRGCARPRRNESRADHTWIDSTLLDWYRQMHEAGHAHSLEAWAHDPEIGKSSIVGGIYGVCIGSAFFGESMFCTPRPRQADGSRHPHDGTDASKICLVTLVRALERAGYTLFDSQMVTDHVRGFGGREITRQEYLERLDAATAAADCWPAARRALEHSCDD